MASAHLCRLSWPLILAVLAMAVPGFVSAANINVTVVGPNHLYADTISNRYEIKDGMFTIFFRSPDGIIRQTNRALFFIQDIEDNIWWTTTANVSLPPTRPPGPNYTCNYTKTSTRFYNTSARHNVASDGVTTLTLESYAGRGCLWVQNFVLVPNPTLYQTEKLNFTVYPSEVKIEILVTCDWKQQVLAENPQLDPQQPLYLRVRRMNPYAIVSFLYEDPIDPTKTRSVKSMQSAYAGWDYHVENSCYMNLTQFELGPRALAPNFNFSSLGGLQIPTANIRAAVYFLAWAVTDDRYITYVDGDVDYGSGAKFTPNNVTTVVKLTIEFAKTIFYDPTMEFFFVSPDPPPASPPEAFVELQTTSIAIPVGIAVAAVGVVAIIGIGVFLGRKKWKLDRKRLDHAHQKSLESRGSEAQSHEHSRVSSEPGAPASQTKYTGNSSAWRASRPSAPLKNQIDS